jgi:hypothetical protein
MRFGSVLLASMALLAGTVAGCGDAGGAADGGDVRAAEMAREPPRLPPPPTPTRVVAPRWSEERSGIGLYPNSAGILVKPDGTEIRGWGAPRVRRYVALLFAHMQYDFLKGRMASVCKHIDRRSNNYLAGWATEHGCEEQLKAYAKKLEHQGFKSTPLRLLWVRTYPGITGIWVEPASGRRFRIGFTQRDKGGWLLDFGDLERREALAMPLQFGSG